MPKESPSKGWAAVGRAAKDLASQDRAVREQAEGERERAHSGWIALIDVKPRPNGDTRRVAPFHVLDLAESIVALGLLEPLVVDRKSHLLAGAHRWEAAKLLAITDAEERVARWAALAELSWPCESPTAEHLSAFERVRSLAPSLVPAQIPVRQVDLDAESEGDRALAIEVAENEKRRDYTKIEVEALADRLRQAGYRIGRGKPKVGERALGPALAVIIGKSERTVRRLLSDEEDIRPSVLISDPLPKALRHLRVAISEVKAAAADSVEPKLGSLLKEIAVVEQSLARLDASKNEAK